MACSCSKSKLVQPVETCIFCGHKHIAAAVAIRPEDPENVVNCYVIGQLACAAKHYNSNFPDMRNLCLSLIDEIYLRQDYSAELETLRSAAWEMVLNNQESKIEYPFRVIVEPIPDSPDLRTACTRIAAAKALYDLELNYKSVNRSYAMGELIAAAWHFQTELRALAFHCRNIWLKVEKLQDCADELNNLVKHAWELAK